jgi:NAD-dependent dihydropyrimidine dehydrogenase PreA subunit
LLEPLADGFEKLLLARFIENALAPGAGRNERDADADGKLESRCDLRVLGRHLPARIKEIHQAAGYAVALSLLAVALAGGGVAALSAAAVASALLTAILTYDYSGSTPTLGGSHFEERRWRIVLDRERCAGVYSCWEVCPEACFEKPLPEAAAGARKVDLAHSEHCIRCGACIVQCPEDALCFEDHAGQRVEPDTIRSFKLNLMGRRAVASPEATEAGATR